MSLIFYLINFIDDFHPTVQIILLLIFMFLIYYLFFIVLFYYSLILPYAILSRYLFPKGGPADKKMMVVFGSGGHTTEMLLMLNKLDFNNYKHLYFVLGHSDTWSLTKIKDFFLKHRKIDVESGKVKNLSIIKLFRSREVK